MVDATTAALPLSAAMRRTTRKIHRRSDALVNLKLALAFTDPQLYARAIALFQPIYERLESLLPQAAQKEPALRPLVELVFSGPPTPLARTKAFAADLAFFQRGQTTPPLTPRPAALESYLARLEEVPPVLLAVYTYHMYMAIMSGGQILRRMTRAALRLDDSSGGGTAIYEFGDREEGVQEAKEKLRAFVDGLEAQVLAGKGKEEEQAEEAAKLRASLLEESMRLFLQNNAVVATFDTGKRGTQAILLLVLLVLVVGLLVCAGLALIRGVVLGGSKG